MLEMMAVVIAALGLAFALAKHNPGQFKHYADGVLLVLWPLTWAAHAWEFALLAARFALKSGLDPAGLAAAKLALAQVALPTGLPEGLLMIVIGLFTFKSFVKAA